MSRVQGQQDTELDRRTDDEDEYLKEVSFFTNIMLGMARDANLHSRDFLLVLTPMNGTFEEKQIVVPSFPDVLCIGRKANAKTAPTPTNGFFDSNVMSRMHAEIWEGMGEIWIRDIKSCNGTFVNGQRLSKENEESEPHELRQDDLLELGIDIVSEDQRTIVHHKVGARVGYAGPKSSLLMQGRSRRSQPSRGHASISDLAGYEPRRFPLASMGETRSRRLRSRSPDPSPPESSPPPVPDAF